MSTVDPVEQLLANGLKNLWYPICPVGFIEDKPVSLRRLGYKLAVWRAIPTAPCMPSKTIARTVARRCRAG